MTGSWTIGDVRVQRIQELIVDVPVDHMFQDVDRAQFVTLAEATVPGNIGDDGAMRMSMHSFLVRTESAVVLVDSCYGQQRSRESLQAMIRGSWSFLDELEAAGCGTDDVGVVICTHLHHDHVGWNTRLVDGTWRPTFPNASYVFSSADTAHAAERGADGLALTFDTAVAPISDGGLARLVQGDEDVLPGLSLMPSPGHSPGHFCVQISSQSERAVITGDIVHHPVQFSAPDWVANSDDDPVMAITTRTVFAERFAATGTRVLGTHFAGTTAGFLIRRDSGYCFVVDGT